MKLSLIASCRLGRFAHFPHNYSQAVSRGRHSPVYTGETLQFRSKHDVPYHFCVPQPSAEVCTLNEANIGQDVILHGYLGSRSDITKSLSFCPLYSKGLGHSIQLVSKVEDHSAPHASFKSLPKHVPVAVSGVVHTKAKPKQRPNRNDIERNENVEILVSQITPLNDFQDQSLLQESNIPPQYRHLQLRQSSALRSALAFRSQVSQYARTFLSEQDFVEVETPLLFKSTPEGAREFLVPTRSRGNAYALPQSPQQYKQILMASGIPRYFQIAKCFRDEDLRADRQPEFTQLDLEMAFAVSEDVMQCVEQLVKAIWKDLMQHELPTSPFPRLSYEEAMSLYGCDKPDTRTAHSSPLHRIEHMIPVDLVSKLTSLDEPIVEAYRLRLDDPSEGRKFVNNFMSSKLAQPYNSNPDGQPGVFVYSSRQPLGGLMPFGFEAAEEVERIFELEEGDIVIIQARQRRSFSGGSTMLGSLRREIYRDALSHGLIDPDTSWNFLWINQFPLLTSLSSSSDTGQGGAAGLASTHHPFTAPASLEDIDMLSSDPLQARADHYDLVLNGVELGGGSRRIHDARLQEFILRDVLRMSDERLKDFEHLIGVLKSGCPPHAGIALGFDRLLATMLGKDSIRDVIAFPKSGSGEDLLVKSPSAMTKRQLDTYKLSIQC